MFVAKEMAASFIEVLKDWYRLEAGAGGEVGADDAVIAVIAVVVRLAGEEVFGSFAVVVTVDLVTRVADGNAVSEPPLTLHSGGVRAPPVDPRGVGFPSLTPGEGRVLSAPQEVGFPSM